MLSVCAVVKVLDVMNSDETVVVVFQVKEQMTFRGPNYDNRNKSYNIYMYIYIFNGAS